MVFGKKYAGPVYCFKLGNYFKSISQHIKLSRLVVTYNKLLAMLCYVMLCYVMLCYVMLCYVMLCYVIFCIFSP